MPWLANEDAAIKAKLLGLSVADTNTPEFGMPVDVRFGLPEQEIATMTFPLLVIERHDADRDPEREARGTISLQYAPEGYELWPEDESSPFITTNPIPYTITYQVTAYARKQWHLTELAAKLSVFERLPARFGFLVIPQDKTVRRLDLIGGPEFSQGRDEQGKRLWQLTYLLSVSSEVLSTVTEVIDVETVVTTVEPL